MSNLVAEQQVKKPRATGKSVKTTKADTSTLPTETVNTLDSLVSTKTPTKKADATTKTDPTTKTTKTTKVPKSSKAVKSADETSTPGVVGESSTSSTSTTSTDTTVVETTKSNKRKATATKDKKVVANVDLSKTTVKSVPRTVNQKPVLSEHMGMNISPTKVKHFISNNVVNKDVQKALAELRSARPSTLVSVVDGKEVTTTTVGKTLSELSAETQELVKTANDEYDTYYKDVYAKLKVANMSDPDKVNYARLRDAAKLEFGKANETVSLTLHSPEFDVHAFNLTFDSAFYKSFYVDKEAAMKTETKDELQLAIGKVSKLKNRFSNNSKVILASVCEYVIKQLTKNGFNLCLEENKKSLRVSHVVKVSKTDTAHVKNVMKLVNNLDTFTHAETLQDESSQLGDKEFTLNNLSDVSRFQFIYYVSETCREVRKELAQADTTTTDPVVNSVTISKHYKHFMSTLVCELLLKLGTMLYTEIQSRNIKTVNDLVVKTVLLQYLTACGVDETHLLEFVTQNTNKYYKYVSEKQEKKNNTETVV